MPNQLIHSTSPYLLQHAHQLVDWYPWGEAALTKAQQEDKPLIVSIGYAACHWCHVMARAAFADDDIAALMNTHFVCVKVDREERPDVDQVYVAALQAMGLQIGWPLHAFLLPDQRPFYGGLYFAPDDWKRVIISVAKAFQEHRPQLEASAGHFTQALQTPDASHIAHDAALPTPQALFVQIYAQLDPVHGGIQGAPKFPMPSVGSFLLHYHQYTHDNDAIAALHRTLLHMACGGIYDQLGGGFARYTTDAAWRIPHFEKMLCDNGLLLSLYAQTHANSPRPLYESILRETIGFLEQHLLHPEGGFYSALDADTAGVEGQFYTWTQAQIEDALQADVSAFVKHYHVMPTGNWQPGINVLYTSADRLAAMSTAEQARINRLRRTLRHVRAQRTPPARDEQVITAWNAMTLQGLLDAYHAVGEAHWLDLALRNAHFIEQHLRQGSRLWHSHSLGQHGPTGYLEDYAWVVRAFIQLYQSTFEAHWLHSAQALVQEAIDHFYDAKVAAFYTVSAQAPPLIARLPDMWDSALPSANAVMAHNLHALGLLCDVPAYTTMMHQMLKRVAAHLHQQPLHMTHWATLQLQLQRMTPIVAIVGPEAVTWGRSLRRHFPTEVLLTGAERASTLPWLAHKQPPAGQTMAYVCSQEHCLAPIGSLPQATAQLREVLGS